MSTDIYFVIGLIVAILATPSVMGRIIERRRPWGAVLVWLIGAGMVGYAVNQQPDAYSLETLPDVFVRVVAQFL